MRPGDRVLVGGEMVEEESVTVMGLGPKIVVEFPDGSYKSFNISRENAVWEPRVGDKVIFTYKSPGMESFLREEVTLPAIGVILHLFEIRGEKVAVVDWHESNPRPHPLPPITCRPVSMLKLAKEQTP